MMGGSSNIEEQEPTAQEIEQFKINQEIWSDYLANAPEDHRRFMIGSTGYYVDDKGELTIKKGGLLNDDGSIKQDAGQAMARSSQQWSGLSDPINPNRGANRVGRIDLLGRKLKSDSSIESGTLIKEQNIPLKGVERVIALGKGNQLDSMGGMQSLAGDAEREAAADARSSFADASANRYLLGAGIGAVGGYYAYQQPKSNKSAEKFGLLNDEGVV